mmetsp:Transcript_45619/g.85439  ORF Transcript_45619/g.85439 Transcript_45619/m.85439 type:complete len:532 (+) Transcript_45619:65-1660(+)
MTSKEEFTMEQVAEHTKEGDYWLAIDGKVYDVSRFAKVHPGGAGILRQFAGKDCTEEFFELHKAEVLRQYGGKLLKGTISGAKVNANTDMADYHKLDVAPYSEPSAYMGWQSPYYKESHKTFRMKLREFVEDVLKPEAVENEEDGEYPSIEIYEEMGKVGLLASRIGKAVMPVLPMIPGIELEKSLGVKPNEFDHFHELIAHEEMGRLNSPSYTDGLGAGFCIGLPPVAMFCPPKIRDKVVPEVLLGKKRICLAISEPAAGSDVAGMLTTATKTPDGKHYIVNGVKKWITNGMFADYFCTGVRTGSGRGGLSMLFISRDMGVETKAVKTTYGSCAGTALVIFDNVKVPVENLMGLGNKGKEGQGFACIMFNFNHERWFLTNNLLGMARAAVADAFMWASQRKAFGKPLMDQAVIRHKLANSAAALESVCSYMDAVTYDMIHTEGGPLNDRLGGPIAMLKYQATRTCWMIADDTVQILGGRGITRTGMGNRVEGFKNYAKYCAVYGGSEEIMANLAIKQALKKFPTGLSAKL